jgi:hypothetical protein
MNPILSKSVPKDLAGRYVLRGSYRLAVSTGLVTGVAAATATAGFLFTCRWSSSTSTKMYLKRVGAKFTCTTAYGTAQRTGCDLILARSYTASASGGTAIDMGSTVANTGNLSEEFGTSLIVANATRVADTDAFTAGTQTLDANPIGVLTGWTAAIGDMVPDVTSGALETYGDLWNYRTSIHGMPIKFTQDEGFVIRNKVLMGATGVGVWDFLVEWDEGVPEG